MQKERELTLGNKESLVADSEKVCEGSSAVETGVDIEVEAAVCEAS